MAIADIDMSSCGKVALCPGYTLLKFGTNWLRFLENITVLLQHVNLSHSLGASKFCIFGYYKAIIEWILTNFFLFSYKFDKLFDFCK